MTLDEAINRTSELIRAGAEHIIQQRSVIPDKFRILTALLDHELELFKIKHNIVEKDEEDIDFEAITNKGESDEQIP